jgi:uncharacterized repeat protein (TIGR01451 family)
MPSTIFVACRGRRRKTTFVTAGCLLAVLLTAGELLAQSTNPYDLASGIHSAIPNRRASQPTVTSEAPPVGGANVVVTAAVGAQNETTIALNPTNPSNLIGGANDYRGADSACGVYRTTNIGRTWTDLGTFALFTPPGGYAFTTAGDPGVAYDANGHAYYLCMYFTRAPGSDATQYVHKSNDSGATWGPPIQVSNAAAQANFDDKGHIAVDNISFTGNRGNVYVAWARLNAGQVRFARSTDGAASFQPDLQVNDAGNGGTGANIAVGVDGAVYVAWLSAGRILIDKSTNGGQNFGALSGGTDHLIRTLVGTIGPVRPLGRVNSFPVIGTDPVDANIVYAVWPEDPAGADDSDILFSRSIDGGNTWSAPIRVNDDVNPVGDFNSQFFAWLAVDPVDASINIVWYDDRTDPNHTDTTPLVDLFFASSNDTGLSFSINTRISTQSSNPGTDFTPAFFGDYNAIAAYGGVAHPLWSDSRTGAQNLMTTQVGGADLEITKSAPSQVTAGSTLTYSITVSNNGPAAAFNIIVTDTLPPGVTYAGSTVPCTGTPLSCTVGNLGAGESVTFTINVTVSASQASGSTLTNVASVAADQQDPDTTDNTASASTIVIARADLRLTKECKPDQPNTQPAGTPTFCDIIVDNLGPSNAANVVITDQIISGTPIVVTAITSTETPADPSPPSCLPATPTPAAMNVTITCTDSILPAGSRITIRVTFSANNAGDVNDTASVTSATPDPDPSNNLAVGRVSFRSSADLRLQKSDAPDPVIAGTNLTYAMTVTNNGPSSAPNVVVRDALPAQVSFVSAAPSQGSCQAGVVPGDPAKPLTCNLGPIANGAGATLTVIVRVNSDVPAGTILVNNADVSSDAADPNTGDNVATAATHVQTSADLAITKASDATVYKPSSVVTYSVNVVNNGPSKALHVVVTDNLPDLKQAIYQSDTGGCVLSTPTTLMCNLGDMAVGESRTFFIYVLIHGNKGLVSNTASVASASSPPTPDPNAGNNSSTRQVTIGK